jgi:hypothetical protein
MQNTALDFRVRRDDLRHYKTQPVAAAELAPEAGQVLLRVEKFAFTANNITYAVFGDTMAYWQYFPAPEGWGRIPVWGFAEVVESKHETLRPGERLYGYLPMSTHVILQPERVTDASFMDARAHRKPLPAAYQLYRRVAAEPGYQRRHDDARALLHPLFMTSFLIQDFLADNALFGARSVVLSSASSKTSLGLAFELKRNRPQGCAVVGLTSARNRAFCEGLGYYDEVVTYDALPTLPADIPTVFVDMAGDGQLLHDIHHHFGAQLKYSCMVGGTHWEQRATQHALPGAKPTFFFAPTQIRKRSQDWGPGGVEQKFAEAWASFLPSFMAWLKVVHGHGSAAVESTYREILEGRIRPEQGHILSLAE